METSRPCSISRQMLGKNLVKFSNVQQTKALVINQSGMAVKLSLDTPYHDA